MFINLHADNSKIHLFKIIVLVFVKQKILLRIIELTIYKFLYEISIREATHYLAKKHFFSKYRSKVVLIKKFRIENCFTHISVVLFFIIREPNEL